MDNNHDGIVLKNCADEASLPTDSLNRQVIQGTAQLHGGAGQVIRGHAPVLGGKMLFDDAAHRAACEAATVRQAGRGTFLRSLLQVCCGDLVDVPEE